MIRWFAACLAVLALSSNSAQPAARPQCGDARAQKKAAVEARCDVLEYAGVTRTYRIYAPKAPRKSPAVVLALHGGDGSSGGMESMTRKQFNRLADRFGFLVVYPDGVDHNWNDSRDNPPNAAKENDDIGFLRALIDRIGERYAINRQRIFATGFSNGGLMAYRLACDAADLFAAIAPVAANITTQLAGSCRPARPISVLIINGHEDPIMPWTGGDIEARAHRSGIVNSAQESFELFAKLDDCAQPISHNPINKDSRDGTALMRHVARDCQNNAEVRLYEIIGGGHAWPGGAPYLNERTAGKVSRELNASEEIWSFFSRRGR